MELTAREVIFHFNKKHLEDSSVPMWILKIKGETHYVNHVTALAPWSTKETPSSNHTKGSIKFKKVIVEIVDNEAIITPI